MANLLMGIVSIVVGVILVAQLFMPTVHNINTSNWSSGEQAIWTVVGLGGAVGILYGTLNVFGIL